jgi:TonB family protein
LRFSQPDSNQIGSENRRSTSNGIRGTLRPEDESDSKTGSLSGIVVDASGARIPQAEVLLVSRDTDFRKSIESDDTGGFSFDDVPAGRYTLEVISKGMGGTFRKFRFNPGGAAPFFPFVLQPGEVMESAIVTASAPPGVAAGSTAVAGAGPRRIRVGGNVEAAKLIEQPPPVYPESARTAGLQGVVILQAAFSPRGVPEDLKVISSPGDDLSKAALDAVRHWRYQPTLLNGDPIEVVTTITVDFRLQD